MPVVGRHGPRATLPPDRTTSTTAPTPPTATTVTAADGSTWTSFNGASQTVSARIAAFSTPFMNRAGRVRFDWDKPGDTIPFEMAVDVNGPIDRVHAELWTNANNNATPGKFDPHPMKLVRHENGKAIFRVDVPIDRIGNYRAVGRISVDGGQTFQWMSQSGLQDVRFRARDEAHDKLNIMEVSVGNANYDDANKRPGTFADMMEPGSPETNGKLTLEHIAKQGKTAIWIMPPFEITRWEHAPAKDDAGSPYAVKDYFTIRSELSRNARGLTGEAARKAALDELKAFIEKAHALGIKVILDVALNHVGHDYEFRDLFIKHDAQGNETREVRKNDFSNVAINPEQHDVIKKRLANPNLPDFLDHVAPWMYGSKRGSAHGAHGFFDRAAGGWGQWLDVVQLNHGRRATETVPSLAPERWWDEAVNEANTAVRAWLTRILQFWAVDVGVDGFRLDHMTGLPLALLEEGLNVVQADVDKHRPGTNLFILGEDFHTFDETQHYVDGQQRGTFWDFLKCRTTFDYERLLEDDALYDVLALSTHDEQRFITHFGDDYRAAARLASLLQLVGGPMADVVGDHFGERVQLPFKQYRGVSALRPDAEGKALAVMFGRAGRARNELAALSDDNRTWLRPRDADLVALTRHADERSENTVFVFANLNNHEDRANSFALDDETRARIDPAKKYQVRDLMSDEPDAPLWSTPLTGQELLERGIFARLAPYQVQVLELVPL